MTSSEEAPAAGRDEFPSAEEAKLFKLIDEYLESLHKGDVGPRSSLFERHPEISSWLRCLELIDRLAPPPAAQTQEEPDLTAAPQLFGKYELLGEVGRGGMGVVYRARQTDLDRTVALKMILSNRLASENDVQRFHAEARAAGSLRHPNIVAIHEAGEVLGQHFFAMDFVAGQSLAQALATGPFDSRRAAQCVAAIARAVQYLHEHQIIHRDLKPSNILLDSDDTPYVTDFGLAKALAAPTPHTQTGMMVGTLEYMAPEQATGTSSEITPRSDVYSLGAILFELLVGKPPFRNRNPIDTLWDVIESEPPRPRKLNPSVPRPLEWICLKCLEKDPRKRYASAAELVDDLERFLRGDPLEGLSPGPVRTLVRWCRREPALASHLGAVAVSSLILQIKYMVSGFDLPYHLMIMRLFAAWALAAVLFRWLMGRVQRADVVPLIWAAADVAFLTLVLFVAEGPLGPLLVGYPLLIVVAGLFFRVRFVSFMTAACLLAYGALVLMDREPVVQNAGSSRVGTPIQYLLIYAAALIVIGLAVGYQTYRVRVLTRYFEDRRH